MKVRELIELLQNKPLDLDVYLQEIAPEFTRAPGVIRLSMATLYDKYVAVMDNAGFRYLAIGCTTSGVADGDDSKVTNVDDEYKNTEPSGSLEDVASEKAREEERLKDKNMKIEITINAPVFGEEKMADYLRLFAQMLLTAEGETVSITIDGDIINPYDKYSRP